MTKAELIAQVAGEAQLRKVDAEKAINSLIRTVSNTLKKQGGWPWLGLAPSWFRRGRLGKVGTPRPGNQSRFPPPGW